MGQAGCRKKRLRRNGDRRFAYRLALHLGRSNVDRMLREMSIRQFLEWRAYFDLEPFGEERADLRSAHIVQTLVNIRRGEARKPAVALKDCTLSFGERQAMAFGSKAEAEQARQSIIRAMTMLTAIHQDTKEKKPRVRRS